MDIGRGSANHGPFGAVHAAHWRDIHRHLHGADCRRRGRGAVPRIRPERRGIDHRGGRRADRHGALQRGDDAAARPLRPRRPDRRPVARHRRPVPPGGRVRPPARGPRRPGQSAADTARAATAPISAELSELGSLVKQLAETVAAHEAALACRHAHKPSRADAGCAGAWHGRPMQRPMPSLSRRAARSCSRRSAARSTPTASTCTCSRS